MCQLSVGIGPSKLAYNVDLKLTNVNMVEGELHVRNAEVVLYVNTKDKDQNVKIVEVDLYVNMRE